MGYDTRNNRPWSGGGQGRKQRYTTEAEPQIEMPLAKIGRASCRERV